MPAQLAPVHIPVRALSQRDRAWARVKLGFSSGALGEYGCAVTALAMLLNNLSGSITKPPHNPATVNGALRQANAYRGKYRNYVNWPAVPAIWSGLEYADRIDCPDRLTHRAELKEIDDRLAQWLPVIIYVDAKKQEPGLQQHFVLIVGQQADGIYLINDPWHGDQATLCPRYGATPARAICGIILFDRTGSS